MTKLKDLNKHRKTKAFKKKGLKMVENACGCLIEEPERFWVVRIPDEVVRMPDGTKAIRVFVRVQCNSCRRIIEGRTEYHKKEEPLIQLPGGLS